MVFDFHTRNHKDLNKPIPEFRKNDLRSAGIQKSGVDIPNGLIIELRHKPAETGSTKKEFYIKEVVKGGLFEKIHGNRISAGDRLVKVNEKPVEDFRSLWDINDYLKKQLKIKIYVERGGLHLEQKSQWDKAQMLNHNGVPPIFRWCQSGFDYDEERWTRKYRSELLVKQVEVVITNANS